MSTEANVSQAIEDLQKTFKEFFEQKEFEMLRADLGTIDFVNVTYKLAFKYTNRYSHQFEGLMLYFNADQNIQANILDVLEWQTGKNGYTYIKELTEKDVYGLDAYKVILTEDLKDFWSLDPVLASAELSAFLSTKYPW